MLIPFFCVFDYTYVDLIMESMSVFMNILIHAFSLFCVCFCVVVFETQSAFLSKETLDGKKNLTTWAI